MSPKSEGVSIFWENAAKLLETAQSAAAAGSATDEMTVLIHPEGGIHVITSTDWPLERLAADRGARTAYRIRRQGGRIAVEGRDGARTCRLEAEAPESIAQRILRDEPRYLLG